MYVLLVPYYLPRITSGLFITIPVFEIVNSPFFSALSISDADFNILGLEDDLERSS
jgi:hypothetical protein